MRFSIITPSFRNSEWLKLCISSVADQEGVEVEHIVQDSCSDDGTQDWLPQDRRVKAFIEKDAGMYDAVNRGFKRATGDILAYLNCDEQYVPGALKAVGEFFEAHPDVEVALAGTIITDETGGYICHRHSLVPSRHGIWFRFPVMTASVFIRRSIVSERGILFDDRWKALGDLYWVEALIRAGAHIKVCPVFTSTFTDSGSNLGLSKVSQNESIETARLLPTWVRLLRPFWVLHHHLRRVMDGHLRLKPTSYSLYTKASPHQRVTIDVPKPTSFWKNRR